MSLARPQPQANRRAPGAAQTSAGISPLNVGAAN